VLVVGLCVALGAGVAGALGVVGAAAAHEGRTALCVAAGCVAVIGGVQLAHVDGVVAAGLLARADLLVAEMAVLGGVVLVVGLCVALGAGVAGALGRVGAAAAHYPVAADVSAGSVATGEGASDLSVDFTDIYAAVTPALLTRACLYGAESAVLQGKMHIVDTSVRLGHSRLTVARLTRKACISCLPRALHDLHGRCAVVVTVIARRTGSHCRVRSRVIRAERHGVACAARSGNSRPAIVVGGRSLTRTGYMVLGIVAADLAVHRSIGLESTWLSVTLPRLTAGKRDRLARLDREIVTSGLSVLGGSSAIRWCHDVDSMNIARTVASVTGIAAAD
jgi:hypothetical protein